MKRIIFAAALFGLATLASAQILRSYLCYRTESPPVIDGRMEAAWQQAGWTDKFVDIEGDKKPLPRFETRVKMLWDSSNFYIFAQLQEPQVWATIAKRDDVIFHDNDFEVFMDPNGDNFEYGEFEINALNTGWDLFLPKPYKDNGHADDSWNIDGIRTAVEVNGTLNNPADSDSGWSVEIAMPWSSLEKISHSTLAPNDSEQWHINFSRVEWTTDIINGKYKKVEGKPEDNWVWSPQGVINMHRPEMWGIVQFTIQTDGKVAITPDSYANERQILHQVYYAEKTFFDAHKVWTDRLNDLNLPELAGVPTIQLNDSGYTASMPTKYGTARIRQDSYFRTDAAPHTR